MTDRLIVIRGYKNLRSFNIKFRIRFPKNNLFRLKKKFPHQNHYKLKFSRLQHNVHSNNYFTSLEIHSMR